MFLELAHTKLHVFAASKQLAIECYRFSKCLPPEERYNMVSQLRRAALSVHLNIAEGSSRKTEPDRKRFYEIARGSVVEIDTILDLAVGLEFCSTLQLQSLGEQIITTFKILSGMISAVPKT